MPYKHKEFYYIWLHIIPIKRYIYNWYAEFLSVFLLSENSIFIRHQFYMFEDWKIFPLTSFYVHMF